MSASTWQPPSVAADLIAHRKLLAALPPGSPVRIWRPSGSPAVGWSWCGIAGNADALVRSLDGDVRSVRQSWVIPDPEN
jgi:hypothetical protein